MTNLDNPRPTPAADAPIAADPRAVRGIINGLLIVVALACIVGGVAMACNIGPDYVETALPVLSSDWCYRC